MIRLAERVSHDDAGRRLDEWAGEWLSRALARRVSRSEVRRWIMAGAIRMEEAAPRRPGTALVAGRKVEAALRAGAAAGTRPLAPPRVEASRILFEDAWLLAIDKPPGIPTHETVDPERPHLVGLVRRLLADRPGAAAASAVNLGVHQRLDRDTSGVILFTKHPVADKGLARQFAERSVAKTYTALTTRPPRLPPGAWTVVSLIGGQEARTDFRRREVFATALLVEARPRTGRKHQIRLHLAEGGLAILGDERYGRRFRPSNAPRLMLHAARLAVTHPVTGAPLVLESPWPADFAGLLKNLRAHPERARARSSSSRR